MADENNANQAETTQEQAQQQNQAVKGNTEPDGNNQDNQDELLTISQKALNAMMAKEKNSGKRVILKQLKVTTEDELPSLIDEIETNRAVKASAETDSQRLERALKEIDRLNNEHTATLTENARYKKEKVLNQHGITDNEDIEIYSIRIERLTNDEKDFTQAAAEYFQANPVGKKAPVMSTSTGNRQIQHKADMNQILFGINRS